MNANTAPIALFVYNRLSHTQRTIEALQQNVLADQSDLIVFSDFSKNENDFEKVRDVRDYVKNISGFKSIKIFEQSSNLGLAKSIISGMNQVLDSYDRVIVMEDDLITSPYFLQFMNEGLNFYADNERIVSVHGYVYPVKKTMPETFFLRYADCWGWATWRRSWKLFEPDASILLNKINESGLAKKFNFNDQCNFMKMLEAHIAGKINSWAIRWYAATFLADKLSLYPSQSLVLNIGNDSSGVHCGKSNVYDSELATRKINVCQIPVQVNKLAFKEYSMFFKLLKNESYLRRLKNVALKIFKKLKNND